MEKMSGIAFLMVGSLISSIRQLESLSFYLTKATF